MAPLLGAGMADAAEPAAAPSEAAQPNDLAIIDAHIHQWDLSKYPTPWVMGNTVLQKNYLVQDLKDQAAGTGLVGMVHVQAAWAPEYSQMEADFVANQAAYDPFVKGFVAYAPVEYGDGVRTYLASLLTRGLVVKGIRRILQGESDPAFGLKQDFIRGVQILPEYGLSFDLLVKGAAQTDSAIEIVRQCPNVSIVLDHLLKPNIDKREFEPWATQMTKLAAFPNVMAKISGLVTEDVPGSWSPIDLKPYIDHAISVFGPDRLIYGGDWPPVLLQTSYANWVQTAKDLTSSLGPDGQRKFFADNARKFYRLAG
jgi:L-fuconolactonase